MLCQHDFSADEGASRHCIPTSASIPVDHIARRARFCHWPLLWPLSSVESASMGKGARGQTKKKEAVPNVNSLAYSWNTIFLLPILPTSAPSVLLVYCLCTRLSYGSSGTKALLYSSSVCDIVFIQVRICFALFS